MTGVEHPSGETAGADEPLVVALGLRPEDLIGLHALATLDGIGSDDAEGFMRIVQRSLRTGLVAHLDQAGLSRNPTADEISTAARQEHEAGLLSDRVGSTLAEQAAQPVPGSLQAGTWVTVAPRVGRALLVAGALFVLVAMIGGYGAGWAWTGFGSNAQVWDWLNLLLLPAAFAMVPLWLRYGDDMGPHRKPLLLGVVACFGLFVLAGYVAPLVWTGFPGQTLWNWLTLIALPVSLTTIQTWRTTARQVGTVHLIAVTSFAVGVAITAVGGYAWGWRWTGYQGNTLWDWLQLLLAPLVINTMVVPVVIRLASGDASRRSAERIEALARQRLLDAARRRASAGASR